MQSENRTALWVILITAVLVIFIGAVIVLSQNNGSQGNSNVSSSSATTTVRTSVATSTSSDALATEAQFDLDAQNNSGQDGTVKLEQVGDQVRVTISVANPMATPQPAHIHNGNCPNPGSVVYPLQNVVNGSSVTMLDTTLAQLAAMGDLAVNIHKSSTESSVYYSCGNLDFLL